MDQPASVFFRCVQEGSRLRVRITSPGYLKQANCQFPRAIRKVGGVYKAPASAVTTRQHKASGKYFYNVLASAVEVVDPAAALPGVGPVRIFETEEEECSVCMDRAKTDVFVPCGHFCCCHECVPFLKGKCPMCRGDIALAVDRSQIQT